jgi:hypothetical protein
MATPVNEDIAADLITALATVTTGNGYNYDMTAERYVDPEEDNAGNTPADGKIVLHQDDPEKVEDANVPHNAIAWRQTFAAEFFWTLADNSSTAIDTKGNQMRADIEKAVMQDPQRSTLAFDTIILDPVTFDPEGGMHSMAVMMEVYYRTAIDDPYTAR